MLKKLTAFFDIVRFLAGKKLLVLSCSEWVDYQSKEFLGSKLELVIFEDNTMYPPNSKGEVAEAVNRFEKLLVKVPNKHISVPRNSEVTLENPQATIYGDFSEKLSLTADEVKVVNPAKA